MFPESGRGLCHVTPTIFGIRSNISPKLLELETSNLVCSFVWGMQSRRTNNFPWKWAWPWPLFRGRFRSSHRHTPRTSVVTIWFSNYQTFGLSTDYCDAVRSAILSTAWLLVNIWYELYPEVFWLNFAVSDTVINGILSRYLLSNSKSVLRYGTIR